MTRSRVDIAVLGAGLAGLTAAYRLREHDILVIESEPEVGGRTRSLALPDGRWLNLGAQYLSPDKQAVIGLARELGVELLSLPGHVGAELLDPGRLGPAVRAEVEDQIRRLEAEQARLRPDDAPELDGIGFLDWLGPCSRGAAAYWEAWHELMMGPSLDLSLHGAMVLWGPRRTSAFASPSPPAYEAVDRIVAGGTQVLAKALAATARSGDLMLGATVARVRPEGAGYRIAIADGREIAARRVVCALPAPIAARVLDGLPREKAAALSSVRYSRFIATPIVVEPPGGRAAPQGACPARPLARYGSTEFILRRPADAIEAGGVIHAWLYDADARVVWDDPDESIRAGVLRDLGDAHPATRGRARVVAVHRWVHALPRYSRGRQAMLPTLRAMAGGIAFAGDYTEFANTDGAVQSGERAARQVLGRND